MQDHEDTNSTALTSSAIGLRQSETIQNVRESLTHHRRHQSDTEVTPRGHISIRFGHLVPRCSRNVLVLHNLEGGDPLHRLGEVAEDGTSRCLKGSASFHIISTSSTQRVLPFICLHVIQSRFALPIDLENLKHPEFAAASRRRRSRVAGKYLEPSYNSFEKTVNKSRHSVETSSQFLTPIFLEKWKSLPASWPNEHTGGTLAASGISNVRCKAGLTVRGLCAQPHIRLQHHRLRNRSVATTWASHAHATHAPHAPHAAHAIWPSQAEPNQMAKGEVRSAAN